MNKIRLLLLIAAYVTLSYSNVTLAQTKSTDETPTAKELWELAIAAKGGREALYRITSIADMGGNTGRSVTLVVLPDRYFMWFDARPTQWGLFSRLYNFKTGFGCEAWSNLKQQVFQDVRTEKEITQYTKYPGNYYEGFQWIQFINLLETRWLKPKPLRTSKDQVEGRRVDRVDVLVEGYGMPMRYAVFLDEKTHLPMLIATCWNINTDEIMERISQGNFRKYAPMKGVMMPTESSGADNRKWRPRRVELNVDYDPQFFDRVPDYNKNGLQWRKAETLEVAAQTILTPLSSEEITRYLTDLMAENIETQQVAVRELSSAGKQVEPQFLQLLATGSAQQRYHAAVLLLQLDEQHPKAIEALTQLVTDRQLAPEYRQDATFGLLRNDAGIQFLAGLLDYPAVQVRRYVIFAFDQLTERAELPSVIETMLPQIQNATKDSDEVVRGMAKEVIQQIKKRKKR